MYGSKGHGLRGGSFTAAGEYLAYSADPACACGACASSGTWRSAEGRVGPARRHGPRAAAAERRRTGTLRIGWSTRARRAVATCAAHSAAARAAAHPGALAPRPPLRGVRHFDVELAVRRNLDQHQLGVPVGEADLAARGPAGPDRAHAAHRPKLLDAPCPELALEALLGGRARVPGPAAPEADRASRGPRPRRPRPGPAAPPRSSAAKGAEASAACGSSKNTKPQPAQRDAPGAAAAPQRGQLVVVSRVARSVGRSRRGRGC